MKLFPKPPERVSHAALVKSDTRAGSEILLRKICLGVKVYDINQFMLSSLYAHSSPALEPKRLRFLTENFAALQGLNYVPLGAASLLSQTDRIFHYSEWWWWPAVITVCVIWNRYIPRYYRQRFGYVEPRSPSNKQIAYFLLALIFLFIFRRDLDRYVLDLSQVIRSTISDPRGQVSLLPLVAWIGTLFASFLKPSLRTLERFCFYSIGIIASAGIAFYPLGHPRATEELLWETLNAGSFGFGLIAMGLYDHFTLVRMMPKKFEENDGEYGE